MPDAGALRFPAEWEPHEATWLGWPHNPSDWPGKFQAIPWVYGEIVRHLVPGEVVRIVVEDEAHEIRARRVLARVGIDVGAGRVAFHRWPTDRGWMRDAGPIFLRRGGARDQLGTGADAGDLVVAGFRFNAWAKYDDWHHDARNAERAAEALGLSRVPVEHEGRPVVLEGGAIDVNGRGTILTTEECLLDPEVQVRNAGFTRGDYEAVFAKWLGARHTIWLGHGIRGDDTHGHVDDLCRFVREDTVVLVRHHDPRDPDHAVLEENRERLQDARLADGGSIEVVPLPCPEPLAFEGRRLPASYANFYIGNEAVLVPTFNDPRDREALGILAELFPSRRVVGIHAVDLVWGLGTLHCLTQQQPKPRA